MTCAGQAAIGRPGTVLRLGPSSFTFVAEFIQKSRGQLVEQTARLAHGSILVVYSGGGMLVGVCPHLLYILQ